MGKTNYYGVFYMSLNLLTVFLALMILDTMKKYDSHILTNCLKFITARENALHDQHMYQNKATTVYTFVPRTSH